MRASTSATCSRTCTSSPLTRSNSAVTADELGAGEVQLRSQLRRSILEGHQVGALTLEGIGQRLLRRPRVGELFASPGQFGLGVSGKGRAAGLGCDGAPPDRQQGDERDGQM